MRPIRPAVVTAQNPRTTVRNRGLKNDRPGFRASQESDISQLLDEMLSFPLDKHDDHVG
jgi:hypothetical protein